MSNSTRCAACKSLRRRCSKDCQLPLHLRAVAVDCMSFEASSRVEDPVYGSVRIISQLQEQIIEAQSELVKTKGEIAFHNAQQQQQMQQLQMIHAIAQEGEDQPSWLSSSQQDLFPNINQQQLEDYNYSNTFCGFEF
ncbi:lob domain-containing protein 24 [Quercus suber]|uniref:Lob domain-containing protein 24 n=1 Tax=Quercus suber TaxID=58331 RepID=A0AAW0M221_QUESU